MRKETFQTDLAIRRTFRIAGKNALGIGESGENQANSRLEAEDRARRVISIANRRRYSMGVMHLVRTNVLWKCRVVPNPAARANLSSGHGVSNSSCVKLRGRSTN